MIIKNLFNLIKKNLFNNGLKKNNLKTEQINKNIKKELLNILNNTKTYGFEGINLEKEIKVLEINPEKLQKKLKNLGFKKIFEGFIQDIYYDFDGLILDQQNKSIRIRQKNDDILITFKEQLTQKKLKIAKEIETPLPGIKDITTIHRIFENFFGMKPFRKKSKHRISWIKKENKDIIEIDIDFYEGIPPLAEIESTSQYLIKKYIKLLGLENNPIKTFGSRGLFKYYGKKYNYL